MSFRFSAACHISQNLSFYGRFLDMGPRSMVGHFTLLHRIIWSKNFDLFTMVYVLNRQCKYRTIALKLPNTMVHATMLQYYGFSIDILGISQLFCTKLAPFAPQKIQKKNLGTVPYPRPDSPRHPSPGKKQGMAPWVRRCN